MSAVVFPCFGVLVVVVWSFGSLGRCRRRGGYDGGFFDGGNGGLTV